MKMLRNTALPFVVLALLLLAPSVVQAQDSAETTAKNIQKTLLNLKINLYSNARDDEKRMKELFASEAKIATATITGVVTSTNGTLFNVYTSKGKVYTVDATNAVVSQYSGGVIALTEVRLRDTVTVRGTIIGTTITATTVRDTSIRIKKAQFYGTITAITGSNSSFVLNTTKNGTQTVQVSVTTPISKNGVAVTFNSLDNDQYVYVTGSWNVQTKVITASVIEIIERSSAIFLQGSVTSKTDTALILKRTNGLMYTIDVVRSMLVSRFYTELSIDDIAVGDTVLVGGIHINDATLVRGFLVRDITNITNTP